MSLPVAFEPGIHYVLQGEGYQVIQLLSGGMLLARNLATNTHTCQHLTELWQHWQENTLEFARSGPNLREKAETTLKTSYVFADLADLPPKLQEITWHRYQLIRPLIALSSHQRTTQMVHEHIQTYHSLLEQGKVHREYTCFCSLEMGQDTPSPKQQLDSPPAQWASPSHLPLTVASSESPEIGSDASITPNQKNVAGTDRLSAPQDSLLAPSPRTVARWLRRYLDSQQDIRSLTPSYHQRGPRHHRLSPLLESLLQQAIKKTYLTNVRAPVTHVITFFYNLIILENTTRPPEEQLPTPGKMTVYRYLHHHLDPTDIDRARYGPATASRAHRQSQPGPQPTRPNQRAEFDFAQLDLLVVDPTDRLPIGRPTIAAIRDKYTGYPLGFFISFDPPSYRLVMECMLYAFLPKTHVKSLFQTQHDYLAFGIPEVLVVDNAIELERDLELACLQLGIELQHMPVRKPWFKGSIERWFRTLNTDLIHVTPGTTFSHVLQRGEYASEKHACITLDRLWELLHLWIVDVYTQEVHTGVGGHPRGKGVPTQLWQSALQDQFVPRLPPSRNDLLVLLTRTTKRKLHHYGIEFDHLLYQSPTLAPLRSKLTRAKRYRTTHSIDETEDNAIQEGNVQIKYHPGDLSRIWVLDPFSNHYLEVEAVDQQYTKDLSLWKHRVIKHAVQKELQRQVNHDSLVLAKARLQQLITDEMRLTRTIRSRQTMARWWNEQVTTWINTSTIATSASPVHSTPEASKKEGQEFLTEHDLEASENEQAAIPSLSPTILPGAPSVADLSAPLPDGQEQVALLPDPGTQKGQTPFEPFPPLPRQDYPPLAKRQNPQRRSSKAMRHSRQQVPASLPSPQETALPHSLIEEKEEQDTHCTTDQQSTPNEYSPDHFPEMLSPITQRKHSFGIEVRSARRR